MFEKFISKFQNNNLPLGASPFVPPPDSRVPGPVRIFLKKAIWFFKDLTRRFIYWLTFPVPRWRPAVATVLLFSMTFGILLYGGTPSYAATYTFAQSSWSGGQNADTAVHPTNQTGWNKYSTSSNISAGSTVSTGTYSLTKDELFSTTDTTADKDTGNTTATWNASTALSIPSGASKVTYYKFDEGSGVTATDSSGNGNTGKLDAGLVAYYKFDEGSGTSATDSSGNGHTGTLTNGPTYSANVPSTNFTNTGSLSFDGSNDYVAIPSFNVGTVQTTSVWVNLDSDIGQFDGFAIGNLSPGLFIDNWNTRVNWGTIGGVDHDASRWSTETWHHVAFVRNGTNNKLYFDGTYLGEITMATNPSVDITEIGHAIYGDQWANGEIDDFRVYNRALSAGEITALAGGSETTSQSPTYSSTIPSLGFTNVKSLDFSGGGQTTFVDAGTPYSGLSNYSISVWTRFNSTADTNQANNILGWGTSYSGANGFTLTQDGSGGSDHITVYMNNDSMSYQAAITTGTWINYIVTVTSGTQVKLYKNGTEVASHTMANGAAGSGSNLRIGSMQDIDGAAYDYSINGRIDDFRFYSGVLTAGQISQLASGEDENLSNSNTAQSLTVDSTTDNIKSVTLTKSDTVGTGTVTYYVSNDGSTFNQVTPSTPYTFSALASDLRWKVVLTGNATVSSISLAYTGYYTSSSLTSSAYDSSDATNLVAKIAWTATGTSGSETVRLQLRTSADGNTWSGWCGASDTGSSCDGSNYFATADNNVSIGSSNPVRSGGDDRWFEYKITFASGGGATASVTNVTVTYVVNAPPEFESAVTASQITDSGSANFGKVAIAYSVRDPDTSTGTSSPGFVTPSFEYNIGAGYVAITSDYLSSNATALKAVDGTVYTTYTAYWDAKTQIANNYLTTAKVRMTLNDNEAANNTVTSASSDFTLDTTNPTITAFTVNDTQDQLTVNISDNTALQYMVSNNADFSADGLNATSGQWQTVGGTSANVTFSWNFATSPIYPTAYLQVRDAVNNTSSTTGVAPNVPSTMYIRDISDPDKDNFAIFVSWDVYSATSGATFSKYEVYRSTNGSSYSLLTNITSAATNYIADFGLTEDQVYYYKVRTVDSNSDLSGYSEVVSQAAHGSGGGTNNADPLITSVEVDEVQSTYARITWTTDVLSDSEVDYSISPSTGFDDGSQTVVSFVTNHSVTVTGLTPNTTYLFRVKSTDPSDNTATDDNGGTGFTFTTEGGPIISNVTQSSINDSSATIIWNTDRDSDSYVTYSENPDLSDSIRVGSASLVGGSEPYTHTVSLTGLDSGTEYYYFVESTDGSSNYTNDNNGGSYYNFTTSVDTSAPVISNVSVPVAAYTAAVVLWQTDKPATTQISYGTASGNYSVTTTIDTTLSIFHAVALNNLTLNTKYFFVAKSESASGYEATSAEYDFTTDKPAAAGGSGSGSASADTTPPIISNIKKQNVASFSADIAFDTNESTVALVQYGSDSDSLTLSAGDPSYSQSHKISLSGLTTGTKYTFKIIAIDKSGNTAISELDNFTTKFFTQSSINIDDAYAFQQEVDNAIEAALPSLAPPFIEKPKVADITDSTATITWRTNVKAYSAIAYASESEYDTTKGDNPYATEVSDTTNKVVDHSLSLTGLKPDTLYHFSVRAFTLPQLQSRTEDLTFATEAPKIKAFIGEVKNTSFRAVWTTTDRASSVVEYRNLKTGETNQKTFEEKTLDHDILVDNLTPGTTYEVNVFGINTRGNKTSVASAVRITTSVDVTPPQITGLKISSALLPNSTSSSQTIISWKTDDPANSTVFYKDGTALPDEKLPNKVEIKNDYVTDHAIVLSSLKPGGLYSIQVNSVDRAGNTTLTPIRTIVVPMQAQSVLDIVFKNFEETFQFLKNVNQ